MQTKRSMTRDKEETTIEITGPKTKNVDELNKSLLPENSLKTSYLKTTN